MDQFLQILQNNFLHLLLSSSFGYLYISTKLKEVDHSNTLKEITFNSLFIFVIGAKISPIFFRFPQALADPIIALYLPMNNRDLLIGGILACVYLYFWSHRKKIPLKVMNNIIMQWVIVSAIIFHFIKHSVFNHSFGSEPVYIYQMVLYFILFCWTTISNHTLNSQRYFLHALIIVGCGQLILLMI